MFAQGLPLEVVVESADPLRGLGRVSLRGLPICQLYAYPAPQRAPDTPAFIKENAIEFGLRITSLIYVFPGRKYRSISTITWIDGLAPPAIRDTRFREIQNVADFAHKQGVGAVQGHIGFLPEKSRRAKKIVNLVEKIVDHLAQHGEFLVLETGQESGKTLRRFVEAVGRNNVRVNFDPANFALYGSYVPLQAFEVLGDFVMGFHCKNAVLPEKDARLGTKFCWVRAESISPSTSQSPKPWELRASLRSSGGS